MYNTRGNTRETSTSGGFRSNALLLLLLQLLLNLFSIICNSSAIIYSFIFYFLICTIVWWSCRQILHLVSIVLVAISPCFVEEAYRGDDPSCRWWRSNWGANYNFLFPPHIIILTAKQQQQTWSTPCITCWWCWWYSSY